MTEQIKWPELFPAPAIIVEHNEDGVAGNPLNFIHVTGAPGVGKTSFALRIIARPPGTPTPPVIAFDLEGGVAPYTGQYAIENISMKRDLPKDTWAKFTEVVTNMDRGQYAVALIDPVEDLEDALMDWVLANPKHFGKDANQYKTSTGVTGLFWGDMKLEAKRWFTLLASKVQTVVMVSHLSQVYQGNRPVAGEMKPKGKDIITKLATVQAWLVGDGTKAPSAIITKSRLNTADYNNADEFGVPKVKPVLPSYVPEFTPAALREYLRNPREFTEIEMQRINPSRIALSDAAQRAIEAEINDQRIELVKTEAREKAKREYNILLSQLIQEGLFADLPSAKATGVEVGKTVNYLDDPIKFEAAMREATRSVQA